MIPRDVSFGGDVVDEPGLAGVHLVRVALQAKGLIPGVHRAYLLIAVGLGQVLVQEIGPEGAALALIVGPARHNGAVFIKGQQGKFIQLRPQLSRRLVPVVDKAPFPGHDGGGVEEDQFFPSVCVHVPDGKLVLRHSLSILDTPDIAVGIIGSVGQNIAIQQFFQGGAIGRPGGGVLLG